MTVTANVPRTDRQARLQQQLKIDRKRMQIAFTLAQEMIARGEEEVRRDPKHQDYQGLILNMAACLVQMSQMHLDQEEERCDLLQLRVNPSLLVPLPSGRAPGGGMQESDYQERRRQIEQ